MTTPDLGSLTRPQLKQLAKDVAQELHVREHDERIALEEKLRSLIEDAGFDPKDLRFGSDRKPKREKKRKQSNGEFDDR